nr:phosphotransferase [Pseudomaricurvus sp. HS19]
MRELTDGLSHQSYLVGDDERRYVVRIENPDNRQLALAKHRELNLLRVTGALSPQPVWFDEHTLVCTCIDLPHWQPPHHLVRIGQTLSQLHRLTDHEPPLDLTAHLDAYWQQLPHTHRDHELHRRMLQLTKQALQLNPLRCLCHNDLIPANMLVDDSGCVLLDWEYAAVNAPGFDLATLAEHGDLNDDQLKQLLRAYSGGQDTAGLLSQANAFRPVVRYLEWLWLLLQPNPSAANAVLTRLQQLLASAN